ncbi:UNVERIFIED_CONTAM: hypothetical protein HDU68_010323 [Siphonaria sp. JEL0065]|nr:hypothetical protein HDU68_010323 [Siphonaria sp. JEL0065]
MDASNGSAITQADCYNASAAIFLAQSLKFDPPGETKAQKSIQAIAASFKEMSISSDSEINTVLVMVDQAQSTVVGFVKATLAIEDGTCETWIDADPTKATYKKLLDLGLESITDWVQQTMKQQPESKDAIKLQLFIKPPNTVFQESVKEKAFTNFYTSAIYFKHFTVNDSTSEIPVEPSFDECIQKFESLGYKLRPFNLERDGKALYTAEEKAFLHHGGFQAPSTFESWVDHTITSNSNYDPNLWFILWDQESVVGAVLNDDHTKRGVDGEALISTVYVDSKYGGKGLGKWLMWAVFAGLRQIMGVDGNPKFTHARLSVDANEPKANGLYQRVGMTKVLGNLWFECVLKRE